MIEMNKVRFSYMTNFIRYSRTIDKEFVIKKFLCANIQNNKVH